MLSVAALTPVSYASALRAAPSRASVKMMDEITFDPKPWTSSEICDKAGLEALAKKCNPVVGFWGENLPPAHRLAAPRLA